MCNHHFIIIKLTLTFIQKVQSVILDAWFKGAKSASLRGSYGSCFQVVFQEWQRTRIIFFPWYCAVRVHVVFGSSRWACDVNVLLFFFHWDSVPSIRPPSSHTMVPWGAIRLELVGPVHMGVIVNNSKNNTAHVATITENEFKVDYNIIIIIMIKLLNTNL